MLAAARCALAALIVSLPAGARIERFGVVIGNNAGLGNEVELRYAEADASRLYDTLKSLGGFPPANLVLLKGETADTARRALITVNDRVRQATARPDGEAVLVVYYSGHADGSSLHLGRTPLALQELEQLVRGSSADFRLLILDSCRSGGLTRVKGGTPAPPVEIRLEGRLPGEGVIFWTSSAANEDAQESDAIRGSFFSHFLNSALVGAADVDGDGRVTIEEAYRYASENTVRATSSTAAGTQHPTFRYELQGQGKLPITTLWDTSSDRGALLLPPSRPYLVFTGSSSGAVIGEVGADDRARRISVKPGTYFVRGRGNDVLLEGTVRIGRGETYQVREDALTATAYARLVRKGENQSSANEVQGGVRLHSTLPNTSTWCHGLWAGFGVHWAAVTLTARASACRASFRSRLLEGQTSEAGADLRLTKSVDFPFVSPYAGIEAGAVAFHQSFVSRGVAPPATTIGASVGAVGGVTLDLPAGFGVVAEAGAALYVFRLEDATTRAVATRAALAFRPAFGLSKTW